MSLTCDQMVRLWPQQWPRPDEENTVHVGRMVSKFGRDFADRDPDGIERSEARSYAMANPGKARYIRTMFNDFLDEGLVKGNPFATLRLPTPGEKPIVVPTPEQVMALVSGAVDAGGRFSIPLATRIIFSSEVGLRFSEQRAVVWPGSPARGNRFSEDLSRLKIEWQVGRNGQLKRPKTEASKRTVMVPGAAQDALSRAMEVTKRRRHGRAWEITSSGHTGQWRVLRRDVGIWIRWHDLRHYCATQLLDRGATVDDVAVQLGCDVDQIRRRYGHPDPEKALARLESLADV